MDNSLSKILIVDDMPSNIQLLLKFLQKEEYQFSIATNGLEALDSIKHEPPDLILLDIILPDINGYDLLEKIKSNPKTKDITVIFLSVKDELEDKIKGFKLGAVDYITKPFFEEEVLIRVNTHLKLRNTLIKYAELVATKDKFLSIIAHDLKNPINNLQNFSEILNKHIKNKAYNRISDIAKAIRNDALFSQNLLDNLLNWARSQTDTIKIEPVKFNLAQIIDESTDILNENAKIKNIKIKKEYNLDTEIVADKNMISTVIRNLLSNALKFTPEGEITISTSKKDSKILVSIKDTGIGITENDIKKLFRLDESFTRPGTNEEHGTGLGLILCKEFINKNGGDIWVKSEEGKGSTFTFSLPLDD